MSYIKLNFNQKLFESFLYNIISSRLVRWGVVLYVIWVSNLSEGTSRELIPDRVFDDGRRVILLTTNDHLEYLAKAPQILGYGTFRITLAQDSRHSLWVILNVPFETPLWGRGSFQRKWLIMFQNTGSMEVFLQPPGACISTVGRWPTITARDTILDLGTTRNSENIQMSTDLWMRSSINYPNLSTMLSWPTLEIQTLKRDQIPSLPLLRR